MRPGSLLGIRFSDANKALDDIAGSSQLPSRTDARRMIRISGADEYQLLDRRVNA